MRNKLITSLIFVLSVCGCAQHLIKIEDPSTSFDGSSYSIKPPGNGEWSYIKRKDHGYATFFFARKSQSDTFSNYAIVREMLSNIYLHYNDELFLNYVKYSIEQNNNQQRAELVESKFEIIDLKGAKTAAFYIVQKDLDAMNKGLNPYLYIKTAGNVIIHPEKKNILIQLDYSERGVESELDIDFKKNASIFFSNIVLKKL